MSAGVRVQQGWVSAAGRVDGAHSASAISVSVGPILLVAFLARVALVIVNGLVTPLPQGTADARVFEASAWLLSQGPRGSVVQYLERGELLLAWLGSLVYSVVGREPLVLGVIMAVVGTATVYVVYHTVLLLTDHVVPARVAAAAAAFFPQLLQNSALFLREAPFSLFFAIAAYGLAMLLRRNRPDGALIFALGVGGATLFHSGGIIALPAAIAGIAVTQARRLQRVSSRRLTQWFSLALLTVVVLWFQGTGTGLSKFGGSFNTAPELFTSFEVRRAEGGAAYPEWMLVRGSMLAEGWKIPIRFLAFELSPLVPFMVRSARHLMGLFDALLYAYMAVLLFRSRRLLIKDSALFSVAVVLIAVNLGYSLGVYNFGTAIRHRSKTVPVMIALCAAVAVRPQWQRHNRSWQVARSPA